MYVIMFISTKYQISFGFFSTVFWEFLHFVQTLSLFDEWFRFRNYYYVFCWFEYVHKYQIRCGFSILLLLLFLILLLQCVIVLILGGSLKQCALAVNMDENWSCWVVLRSGYCNSVATLNWTNIHTLARWVRFEAVVV